MTNSHRTDHLSKEADRLLNDEILNLAIESARQDALEKLSDMDLVSDDALEAQALCRALKELKFTLNRYILAEV